MKHFFVFFGMLIVNSNHLTRFATCLRIVIEIIEYMSHNWKLGKEVISFSIIESAIFIA